MQILSCTFAKILDHDYLMSISKANSFLHNSRNWNHISAHFEKDSSSIFSLHNWRFVCCFFNNHWEVYNRIYRSITLDKNIYFQQNKIPHYESLASID